MQPMLATAGNRVPTGPEWTHEVKWDGVRLLVTLEPAASSARLTARTRSGRDVSALLPELAALAQAPAFAGIQGATTLDGELVVFVSGRPSFRAAAERVLARGRSTVARMAADSPAHFLIFDLLTDDGQDLTGLPLRERIGRLDALDLDSQAAWQRTPGYADGEALLSAVAEQGLEGIISKRLDSRYQPGRRSADWLKFPLRTSETFTVGGFRFENDGDARLGALLIGEQIDGRFVFRGRVGSGFSGAVGRTLLARLRELVVSESPFVDALPKVDAEGTVWVRPAVQVEVRFLERTADGRLRQPVFRGIRADLSTAEVPNDAGAVDG